MSKYFRPLAKLTCSHRPIPHPTLIPIQTPTLTSHPKKPKQKKRQTMQMQPTKRPWNNYNYNISLQLVNLQEGRQQVLSSLVDEA